MKPSNWSAQAERGGQMAYWGMKLMLAAYRVGGRRLFALILYPVLGWFFIFGRTARHASQRYLAQLKQFAPQTPLTPSLWLSWRHFLSFADTMLDKLHAWSGAISYKQLHTSGREQMLERLDARQGGIMLTAHLGNTETMQALSAGNAQLRLNVLVHTQHAAQFNRILTAQAPQHSVRLIQVNEIDAALAADLAERVANGEWLVIAADRVPVRAPTNTPSDAPRQSQRTLTVDFLGSPAPLPLGPHLLALLMHCPLVLAICVKQSDGLHLYFETLSEACTVPRAQREIWLQQSAQHYADRLAHYCQLAPLQWFNFYPFWTEHD